MVPRMRRNYRATSTSDPLSELPICFRVGHVHTAHRVRVTQSEDEQVSLTAHRPVFLEDMTLPSPCSIAAGPRLPEASLQIYDVDTITFPSVNILFYLEVKVGTC